MSNEPTVSKPRLRFAGTAMATRDPDALASFYERLLGWPRIMDDDDWVALRHPDGGTAIAFHVDEHFVRPVWPSEPGAPMMTAHLDLTTDDLEAAVAHAVACGAAVAAYQPNDTERVMLDPDGHPFCLIATENW